MASRPVRTRRPIRGVFGVEVDGTRAAVVHVVGKIVARAATHTAATPEQALARAAQGLSPGVPVVVSLPRDTTATASVQLPEPARDHDHLEQMLQVAARTDRSVAVVLRPGLVRAAVAAPPALPTHPWRTLVAAWPKSAVQATHHVLAGHTGPVRVTAPALVTGPVEGLVLALRHGDSELTLTRDGIPIATRSLDAGGLDTVEAVLGQGTDVGAERVALALASGGTRDQVAGAALDAWIGDVLTEVTTARSEWAGQGLAVPTSVYVVGPAARAVGLDFLLTDHGLSRRPAPPDVAAGLLKVPPTDRPQTAGAYLAATAPDGPVVVFPDPAAPARAAAAARRAQRRTWAAVTAALVAGAALPPAAVAGVGMWTGHQTRSLATTLGDPDTVLAAAHVLTAAPDPAPDLPDLPALTGEGLSVDTTTVDLPTRTVTLTGTAQTDTQVGAALTQWRTAGYTPARVSTTPGEAGVEFVVEVTW